jgi:CheY-like chemotaxis protein
MLGGYTILVIDDNEEVREMFRLLLEILGARVMLAADGMAALTQVEWRTPDAILCDLSMPVMDGLEFAQRLREVSRYRRILLIAVTVRDAYQDFIETVGAGFDGHLVKPLTQEALNALAERLAQHRRLRLGKEA